MSKKELQKNAETQQNDTTPREVLSPEQASQHYRFRVYQPSDDLAPFIDYYWIMRWDLQNKAPFTAEVIPSPYTNLTFMPEGARVTGVTTGKYTYDLKGTGAIVGAKFKPGSLHAFWPKNIQGLTDTHFPASDIFPEINDSYNQAILAMPDVDAVKKIEALLVGRQPRQDKYLLLINEVISYLEENVTATLAEATTRTGLSERRLQEIFREYVGVGVKWISLRIRLIKATELAATTAHPDWSATAQDLGYTDQSHFINDFKRVIGQTPSQYAASLHKDNQKVPDL